MTYAESAALMTDPEFRARVKVACLKFANYIMNESSATDGRQSRLRWATNCLQNPEVVANQSQPPAVMDATVQEHGKDISDEDLQRAVETTVKQLL